MTVSISFHANKEDRFRANGYAQIPSYGVRKEPYVVFQVESGSPEQVGHNQVSFFLHDEKYIDEMICELRKAKRQLQKEYKKQLSTPVEVE